MPGKFEGHDARDEIIARAAYAIAGHGFTDGEYGDVQTIGWNGLVTVSAVTLLNVDETELSTELRAIVGDREVTAWLHESGDGFVTLLRWSSELSADIVDAFEREAERADETEV